MPEHLAESWLRPPSAPADADARLPRLEEAGVAGDGDAGLAGVTAVPQEQVEAGRGAGHRAWGPVRGVPPGRLPAGLDAAVFCGHVPGAAGIAGPHVHAAPVLGR